MRGKIELNADVVSCCHRSTHRAGRRPPLRYDDLISVKPLPELIKLIGDAAPERLKEAARGLKHISIRNVARENTPDKH